MTFAHHPRILCIVALAGFGAWGALGKHPGRNAGGHRLIVSIPEHVAHHHFKHQSGIELPHGGTVAPEQIARAMQRGGPILIPVELAAGVDLDEAIASFRANDLVAAAEADVSRDIDSPFVGPPPADHRPSGGLVAEQWALNLIHAYDAWRFEVGDPSVVVALVDSGIDRNHPDLALRIWTNPGETLNGIDDDGNGYIDDLHGWDFIGDDNEPQDEAGHGTHIAGIIAARGRFSDGIAGLANVTLMPLRVLDADRRGVDSDTIAAIRYAVRNGAKIINISLGGTEPNRLLQEACDEAYAAGVLIIAAAGNASAGAPLYPARYNSVIAVGASDWNREVLDFSNRGDALELVAPGLSILSTVPGGNYNYRSGTSTSTAHVTGIAALLASSYPEMVAADLRAHLVSTAIDIEPAGWDRESGFGQADAFRALWITPNDQPLVDLPEEFGASAGDARTSAQDIAPVAASCGLGAFLGSSLSMVLLYAGRFTRVRPRRPRSANTHRSP